MNTGRREKQEDFTSSSKKVIVVDVNQNAKIPQRCEGGEQQTP